MVTFIDELINQFPDEPDFVMFRIFIKDRIPAKTLMDTLIYSILPLEDLIKERDEDFFSQCNLFEGLTAENKTKMNHFKRIWNSPRLDDEDKEVIFKWFSSFIFLARKYQSEMQTASSSSAT